MSTVFPIDVTVDRLVEFLAPDGTINSICLSEIGRLPTHTKGDPVGEILLLMALRGADGAALRSWLHDSDEAIAFRERPTDPVPTPMPPAVARGPLPPFDRATTDPDTGAPLPVHTRLTQSIPASGTRRWWRGNAWGVTVPGLPAVPGGATGPAQNRVLTWFLDRWTPEWQDRILRAHAERGYDRFVLSWPDSRDGAGQSLDQYVETTRRVAAAGLLPVHMLLSKVFDGVNPDPSRLDPVIDALLAEDLIPLTSVGWELNLFNSPEHLQRVIDHVDQRLADRSRNLLYVHFAPHYASWQPDRPGGNGGEFWRPNIGKLTGLLYQCNPSWSVGMMQARINDVLVRLNAGGLWGLPVDFDVVVWETIATLQFENQADEDRGDLVGYETLCAQGPLPVMGFGNGARYPDGRVI
jgi:hypothetical protein